MTVETITGIELDGVFVKQYFRNLVNQFFKILPMWENSEPSLSVYMCSLQKELLGCKRLITLIDGDPSFISILAILQYLIDTPDTSVQKVRSEVFKAISICNKMEARYSV